MNPINLCSADKSSDSGNISKSDESTNSNNGNNASNEVVETEERFSIHWRDFHGNLISNINALHSNICLADVTVVSDDGIRGSLHKFILANASSYFLNIFQNFHESKHPTVILSGIRSDILQLLVNYIYVGSVDVPKGKLDLLISAGRSLKIKGLMEMQESKPEKAIDLSVATKQANTTEASTSSFMMSPTSEPDTSYQNAVQKNDKEENKIETSVEDAEKVVKTEKRESGSSDWERSGMKFLLVAAEINAKKEKKELASAADDSDDDNSPLFIDEDACNDDEDNEDMEKDNNSRKRKLSEHETGHATISAVSAASAVDTTRISAPLPKRTSPQPYFRFDAEQTRTQSTSSQSLRTPAVQLATSATPHQLGFTNPLTLWPRPDQVPEFYQILPSNVALSNNIFASSPTTIRIGSDYSIQRLSSGPSEVRNITVRRDLPVPPTRPTVSVSTSRTSQWTLASGAARGRPEVTSQNQNQHGRRSLPSTSTSNSSTNSNVSRQATRKSTSPSHAGVNWKSRQPTECDLCNRMFSNKFNLKQHYMNMHAKGGEVKCDECGKMVKNKWYMRRHKVTHHGAPLRKVKKSLKNNNDSDSEE